MMDENFIAITSPHILNFRPNNDEIIRIAPDGRLFWRGREVETDDDFRAAMLDLANRIRTI
jgi:hypothetical protein